MKRTQTASRISACLLALLLMFTAVLLCACGESESTDTSTENAVSGTDSSAQENTDIPPKVKNLEGREINVLCWNFSLNSNSIQGYTGEIIYSDEDNSSQVDVAKKAVIDYVETEYNCKIDGILDGGLASDDVVGTKVTNMVTTGTYDYDIIFHRGSSLARLAQSGVLTNLNNVGTLNLKNSWWDQNAVEQLSIANKLFYVNGDINTYDDLGTWCVIFNKTLKTKLGIEEDFYETARKGDWTLDHFIELCKGVTTEKNGDGVLNEFDQWAFGTETYNVFVQVLGGGLHVVEKDGDDLPYISAAEHPEQLYSALEKITNFYQSGEVMVANGGKYTQYANPWEATVHKAFIEGRELFYMCGLINLAGFRNMEDDIGALPIPKTFEDQEQYYHTVSVDNSSYMALPKGVPDIEDLGLVIEALAMKSQELVTPAFYDKQLKQRDVRDDESSEVLDLLFATRSFDLGPAYNWGNLMTAYYTIDSNFASRFDGLLDAAETAMQLTIDDILDLTEEE